MKSPLLPLLPLLSPTAPEHDRPETTSHVNSSTATKEINSGPPPDASPEVKRSRRHAKKHLKWLAPENTGKKKGLGKTHRKEIADKLKLIRTPDGKQKYGMIGDKPVIWIDVVTVLNDESEKFQDKLLCDGLVMNAGDACVFSCTFCYVPGAVMKLHAELLEQFNQETGLNMDLSQVVIRRRGFLDVLKRQLLNEDGSRIYNDPNDRRVLYSSTLVDVAGTMEMLKETAAACILIFENTNWDIRLLSKSPLLALLVTKKMIPEKYHHRLILGFSTGTLDDDLAAAIEHGTGHVSKRIAALHVLQDLSMRAFAMICPSLPYDTQEEYDEFSRQMCEALRIEKCETVWAEVINLRGDSLTATAKALRDAGYATEAQRLEAVSGPGSKDKWEEYARMTFAAHAKHVPAGKLRFLQYVTTKTAGCWKGERQNGAVLLGSYAEKNNLITVGTSAPTTPLPDLEDSDILYREERENIVTTAVKSGIAAAEAIHQIKTYRDGLLWRKDYRTFEKYCQAKWGYAKSHAYRQLDFGGFIEDIKAHSPNGEKVALPVNEGQIRPLLEVVPEQHRVACWNKIVAEKDPELLTGPMVDDLARKFVRTNKLATKPPKPAKVPDRLRAIRGLEKFKSILAKLPQPGRFDQLLLGIGMLINQDPQEPEDLETTMETSGDMTVSATSSDSPRPNTKP